MKYRVLRTVDNFYHKDEERFWVERKKLFKKWETLLEVKNLEDGIKNIKIIHNPLREVVYETTSYKLNKENLK